MIEKTVEVVAGFTLRKVATANFEMTIARIGPFAKLTLLRGGEILFAEIRPHRERDKLFAVWEILLDGLYAREGVRADERRERARGGME